MNYLKRDIILGHQSAIDTYTKCINDLMPMPRNELKDALINQWLKEIKVLSQELKEIKNMTNTISVATTQGWKQFSVMHKNRALQVVEVPTQSPNAVFYNTVHDNGFRLPETDTDVLSKAIFICNWCVENFPEFAKEDLNIIDVSEFRKEQFREQLWKFKFEMFEDHDDDLPF